MFAPGTPRGLSTTSDSAGRSSGERLVASTVGVRHAASNASMASAAADVTCSQLSTTTSAGVSDGEQSRASNELNPSCPANAPPTASASSIRVRSTTWTPSS